MSRRRKGSKLIDQNYSDFPILSRKLELALKEMCLRQRSRILEQIREIKRIDVDTFHYETLYQVRKNARLLADL